LSLIDAVLEPVSLPDPDLAACLAAVPDPRDQRGIRHSMTSLLMASVAAALAGARSFTAIGEWVADAPPQVMAALGIRRDALTGRFDPPDEATIRRALGKVDGDALDAAVGTWLAARAARRPGQGRRRAVAVDGKSLRGTRHSAADGQAAHLLAAADQATGAVLSQRDVDGKTNEITRFEPLLKNLNLAGTVVTADALHTQREAAEFIVAGKNAHYILVVKKNQPGLHARIKNLPWKDIPAGHSQKNRGHGREERRDLKATAVAAGLGFPHAARAIRIIRRVRPISGSRKWKTRTIYAITSLHAAQANPAELAGWIRGHWQIEALHHIRDVTYAEDSSQARTRNGPRAMATLRNLAIGTLKTAGHRNIAAATRHHARDATRILTTLGLSPP
jgi:predicted transposase YbfD/YdcC